MQTPLKCSVCSASYQYQSSLKKHMLDKHQQPTVKCELCPSIKFVTERQLKTHVRVAHTEANNDAIFACGHPGCEVRSKTLREWQMHHDRYSKECVHEKKLIKKEIKQCKLEITRVYKENEQMRNTLKEHGIDYKHGYCCDEQECQDSIFDDL